MADDRHTFELIARHVIRATEPLIEAVADAVARSPWLALLSPEVERAIHVRLVPPTR